MLYNIMHTKVREHEGETERVSELLFANSYLV